MAKDKVNKFDSKKIPLSLVKNVNEEQIIGYRDLVNCNPGKIMKSMVQRAGIRQNDKALTVTTYPIVQTFDKSVGLRRVNGFLPRAFGTFGNVLGYDYDLSTPDNIYETGFYTCALNMQGSGYLTGLSVEVATNDSTIANPSADSLKCSIYAPINLAYGGQPYGTPLGTSTVPLAGLDFFNYITLPFTFNNIPVTAGAYYLVIFEVIKAVPSTPYIPNLHFVSLTNEGLGVLMDRTVTPSSSEVSYYADLGGEGISYKISCPAFKMVIASASQTITTAIGLPNIKHVQVSNKDTIPAYYISGLKNNQVPVAGVSLDNTGYVNVNTTPLINPTVTSALFLNYENNFGTINPLKFQGGYPGAFYGFKTVGFNQNWLIAYGSQLKNKVPVTQPVPGSKFTDLQLINNTNYMLCKRYPVGSDPLTDVAIPVTPTVIAEAVKFEIIKIGLAYAYVEEVLPTAIISGQYEYAIEWIDAQGFSYNPGTYDPADYSKKYDVAEYDIASQWSYIKRNSNTRFVVDLTYHNADMKTIFGTAGSSGITGSNYAEYGSNHSLSNVKLTIPLPKSPTPTGWACNIYRRTLSQVYRANSQSTTATDSFPAVKIGSVFQKVGIIEKQAPGTTSVTFTDTQYEPLLTTTFDLDLFIPRAADMDEYKGHLIAVGDPIYKNYIFPSRNLQADFRITDAFPVSFGAGDEYFNACITYNNSFYCFSNHGTWQVNFVGGQTPFILKQISQQLGCISTSKGIVQIGAGLIMPTIEGLKLFDGANYHDINGTLNNVWNNVDTKQQDVSIGGSQNLTVGHVPAFDISGAYDQNTKQIIFKIPAVGNDPQKIYVIDVSDLSPSNTVNEWQSYEIPVSCVDIYPDVLNNSVGMTEGNYLMLFDKSQTYDATTTIGMVKTNDIESVIESTDIDFAEKTVFKSFRLWGTGTATLTIYLDKESTGKEFADIVLDPNGAKGVESPLGYVGNYFRYKITSTDPLFEFRGIEIPYINKGVKSFDTLA